MKIIIFSTGSRCEYLLELNQSIISKCEIVAFVDNDKEKQGKLFHGVTVIPPEKISCYEYDIIYIANILYYDQIYDQLVNDLKIDGDKIKPENYLQVWFGKRERKKHYAKLSEKFSLEEKDNHYVASCKIVVYTAIFGNYDDLKDPEYADENMDYVCFTDNKNIKSDVWKIKLVEGTYIQGNPRRSAKIYKILPHKHFPEHEISVWIDGTAVIRGNLREYITRYMKYSDILFCPHPWDSCIYEQANDTFDKRPFDDLDLLKPQMEKYKSERMPEDNGMISGGFIVRRHNEINVVNMMERWWDEICRFSTQDQISFAYLAWKNDFVYDIADEWIYDNPYIYFVPHKYRKS